MREAQLEPTSQKAAVTEAGGAFPLMAMRLLAEDLIKHGQWVLTSAEPLRKLGWWEALATIDRAEFLKQIEPLNQNLKLLREIFES